MKRVTTSTLLRMKQHGEPITMLTAYDAAFARILDHSGVEAILVGDSLGMVVQGRQDTLAVDLQQMIYHTQMVSRGAARPLIIADLPFLSYTSPRQALESAGALMREGGAQMVKLEGGEQILDSVEQLTRFGVPVCAHLGLTPQSVHKIGGYKVQGRSEAAAASILAQSHRLEQAGADLLVLECVPAQLAATVRAELTIPVIGIGAGRGCDGQVLVLHDILGITLGAPPSFSHNFLAGRDSIPAAVAAYVAAVRDGSFPTPEQSF
ncbi:MAG: 3-methyl-2-oxobutanoate hydroxymethyltransferase [Gammaproteobacteria bacterium]|nr:3-methyl-2-oxobutanoate hydroxymethyltransferase [Gammaproteobacteria bacterium]